MENNEKSVLFVYFRPMTEPFERNKVHQIDVDHRAVKEIRLWFRDVRTLLSNPPLATDGRIGISRRASQMREEKLLIVQEKFQ